MNIAAERKRHPQSRDPHQAWDSFPLPRYKICKIPMRKTDNPVTSSNGMHVFSLIHLSFAHYTSCDVSEAYKHDIPTNSSSEFEQRKRPSGHVTWILAIKQISYLFIPAQRSHVMHARTSLVSRLGRNYIVAP